MPVYAENPSFRLPAESARDSLAGQISQSKTPEQREALRRDLEVVRVRVAIEKALARLPKELTPDQRHALTEIFTGHAQDFAA